jgi:hypothetical protein
MWNCNLKPPPQQQQQKKKKAAAFPWAKFTWRMLRWVDSFFFFSFQKRHVSICKHTNKYSLDFCWKC